MGGSNDPYEQWLASHLHQQGAIAGTVHLREGDMLQLRASVNIPEPVLRVTATIPRGKGMAGLALEREKPVQTCNLQTDTSGDVRPGARAVDAQGAVALPVKDKQGQIRAVVGFAFPDSRELSDAQLVALTEVAQSLPS